ncbi:MAG: PAS domain S-box protein [Verrucomicrobiota bacterium]
MLPALLKDRAPSQALLNLRAAVEQSANMIVITDIRGNIEYVNPSFEKATGYSAAEAAGKNPSMLKSGEQGAKFYRHLWTTIRSGKIWQGEFHNRRKDGSLYWEMATISPVQNDKGETVRYLAIKEDITEQKQAQDEILRINRQLAEATAKAERATAAKSEFLATMTHELRNPLTGVLGFAEILAGTALDDEQQSLTEGIRESGIHLLDLINDILDFSSIEKGVLSIHAAPFALAPLVKLSSELIRKSAADKGLAFHCDVAAGVPEQITGDERRIRQILINLLANAVKFTSDGSVRLRVTRSGQGAPPATQGTVGILPASENQIDRASQKCRVECLAQGTQTLRAGSPRSFPDLPVSGGSFLDFSVEDTGLGISSEALARLFQLFTQADATISRKYGGTGIGLAVSQRLAEAMGGTISVVSAPGKGSTFTFHFPLEAPAGGAVPSRLLIGADGASPSSPSAATPIRPDDLPVLVVEDERTNALVVGKMLQILGYRAEFAANGVEAVEAFAPGKYLAIFMDLRMPVMNGFEAAGIIRSRESGSRVPIILLSANVMPGSRETYLAAGMDDFLSKPFKRAELAAKLANVSQR